MLTFDAQEKSRSMHMESNIFECRFSVLFVCFFFLSSFPIKMLATDAKMQTIESDPFLYDGQMFLR